MDENINNHHFELRYFILINFFSEILFTFFFFLYLNLIANIIQKIPLLKDGENLKFSSYPIKLKTKIMQLYYKCLTGFQANILAAFKMIKMIQKQELSTLNFLKLKLKIFLKLKN